MRKDTAVSRARVTRLVPAACGWVGFAEGYTHLAFSGGGAPLHVRPQLSHIAPSRPRRRLPGSAAGCAHPALPCPPHLLLQCFPPEEVNDED